MWLTYKSTVTSFCFIRSTISMFFQPLTARFEVRWAQAVSSLFNAMIRSSSMY